MGIDLRSANASAAELGEYAATLRNARNSISAYRSTLVDNWEGREVGYYTSAAASIERRLKSAADELDSIGGKISSTANEIWQEEEAERRRREEEERRRQEEEQRRQEEEERERQEAEERAAMLAKAAENAVKRSLSFFGGGGGGSR